MINTNPFKSGYTTMTGEFSIAIRAMTFLCGAEGLLSSDKLALSIGVNPARVRKVMSRLKTAGLISAKEGASGGYFLARNADGITLDMLVDALGIELIAPRARADDMTFEMEAVMSELFRQLNGSCRERLKLLTLSDMASLSRQAENTAIEESLA